MPENLQAFLHFGGAATVDGPRSSLLTIAAPIKEKPLWWHERGLQYTASGYGSKIPTPYMVKHNSRWRRVYAACRGNSPTLYIGTTGAWIATVDIQSVTLIAQQ